MIYLTFDSNIWIYSLDESWTIENQLDYLEPWVREGKVKLLLPEIILSEWSKHKENQVKYRKKKLDEFFKMAEEIMPSAFFSDFKNEEAQNKLINEQLERTNNLILSCEIIPEYKEVNQRVISDGIIKKAPQHKKSSVADAVIVFSLIEFAKQNRGNEYFFISNNTEDFYSSNKKDIHDDLKEDFRVNNIKPFKTLNYLIKVLKSEYGLSVDNDKIQINKNKRIRNRIKEIPYNPKFEKVVENETLGKSFIQNSNTIELILKERKPTKEQAIFVLALIESDEDYEREFYNKLSNSSWFNILKRRGVFNPKNNPKPVKIEKGFNIPTWLPIVYLEKLSIQIREEDNLELVDDIIKIIKDISQNPVDNYMTWYLFIKILVNLPNEKISKKILDFIPLWLSGRFRNSLQSKALCEELLPKFLSDNSSKEDTERAEIIIHSIFNIERIDGSQKTEFDNLNYRSTINNYILYSFISNSAIIPKIAECCSNDIIVSLADNLRLLFYDYSYNIKLPITNNKTEVVLQGKMSDIDFIISVKNEVRIIQNFDDLSNKEIEKAFFSILKELDIEFVENESNLKTIERLKYHLHNGAYNSWNIDSIHELSKKSHYGDNIIELFLLAFKELLNAKIKYCINEGVKLLQSILLMNKYQHPMFLRVFLFVITDNWELTKNVFIDLLKTEKGSSLFTQQIFYNEFYELLNKNQRAFKAEEISLLENIIEYGFINEVKDREYWKLRWFSALRDISPFKEKYIKLSDKIGLKHEHFETSSKVRVRSGTISPMSVKEVLKMQNEEIASFILQFNPKRDFDSPSIEGMAEVFQNAIVESPQRFSDEVFLFKNLQAIYLNSIGNALRKAWESKKGVNWENTLLFFKYLLSDEHKKQNSLSNDIAFTVLRLLSSGIQSDDNAFDLELLPLAKDILKIYCKDLNGDENKSLLGRDYPTYSLNSKSGLALRALLDYSLRRARNLEERPKWEEDVKQIFEHALKEKVLNAYILLGWHYSQFFYLDGSWMKSKIKEFYSLDKEEWQAFMGGFTFTYPPNSSELYQLFYPHYIRAIADNVNFDNRRENKFINHVVSYFFWNKDWLKGDSLVIHLINHGNNESILTLVNFIGMQKDYYLKLDEENSKKFADKIKELWIIIANKYNDSENEEERKVLISLSKWIVFISVLDSIYTDLLLKSITIKLDFRFNDTIFLENLVRLQNQELPQETAIHIGRIIQQFKSGKHISVVEQKIIINIITFLYENNQKEIADVFCNNLTQEGYDFLIELYKKYNS